MTEPRDIPEVEFATASIVVVDESAVERVRQAAQASPRRRARLCLHSDSEDRLHNMLIVLLRGTVVPVHRHPHKPECYHVLSGRMSLIVYDAMGENPQRILLGAYNSGRSPLCRIAAGMWHTVEVESDEVVLHESTIGPFQPSDTEVWPADSK